MTLEKHNSHWGTEEVEELKELYKTLSISEIAPKIGRTYNAVKSKVLHLGIRKTPEELSSLLSRKTSSSQFKKGGLPYNTLTDGAITIRFDGTKGRREKKERKIYYIRISKAKWQPLHHYLWENVYGEIPEKTCVGFKDGNTLNCLIDNLYLLPKSKNAGINSGSITLSDGYVARAIVGIRNIKTNKALYEELLNNKPLLELKRQQLLFNREIKKHQNGDK